MHLRGVDTPMISANKPYYHHIYRISNTIKISHKLGLYRK